MSRTTLSARAAVTADDWGLSRGVNEGILALAAAGVVQRVSILATAERPGYRLRELIEVPGVELGLHLNLTYGRFEQGGPLLRHGGPAAFAWRWLRAGTAGRKIVRDELGRQLRRLRGLGVEASYLDSHHHVHLLPGVVEAIGGILDQHGIAQVRLPVDPGLWRTRRLPVLLLSIAARRALARHALTHLPCFYPTAAHFRDPRRLAAAIHRLGARHDRLEVIVHPAAFDDLDVLAWPDPYRQERVIELRALLELAPALVRSG